MRISKLNYVIAAFLVSMTLIYVLCHTYIDTNQLNQPVTTSANDQQLQPSVNRKYIYVRTYVPYTYT